MSNCVFAHPVFEGVAGQDPVHLLHGANAASEIWPNFLFSSIILIWFSIVYSLQPAVALTHVSSVAGNFGRTWARHGGGGAKARRRRRMWIGRSMVSRKRSSVWNFRWTFKTGVLGYQRVSPDILYSLRFGGVIIFIRNRKISTHPRNNTERQLKVLAMRPFYFEGLSSCRAAKQEKNCEMWLITFSWANETIKRNRKKNRCAKHILTFTSWILLCFGHKCFSPIFHAFFLRRNFAIIRILKKPFSRSVCKHLYSELFRIIHGDTELIAVRANNFFSSKYLPDSGCDCQDGFDPEPWEKKNLWRFCFNLTDKLCYPWLLSGRSRVTWLRCLRTRTYPSSPARARCQNMHQNICELPCIHTMTPLS